MASKTKKTLLIIFAVVAAVAVVVLMQIRWSEPAKQRSQARAAALEDATGTETKTNAPPSVRNTPEANGADVGENNLEMDEADELRDESEMKAVDAFDALTDKWMEKTGREVTTKDVDEFAASFKSIPARRREECLQRALNLVPDEHVLLLAGILFDKTIDKELVELVFNDVLNRDESVKKLLLPMIYKDKTHPCWADTAWILDVTGETPKKEKIK